MRRMYSKKQVEEIAQSAVSSGTKLYRHNLYIVDEQNEIELLILIISDISESFITYDGQIANSMTTQTNLIQYFSDEYSDLGVVQLFDLQANKSYVIDAFVSGSLKSYRGSLNEDCTDTVTDL